MHAIAPIAPASAAPAEVPNPVVIHSGSAVVQSLIYRPEALSPLARIQSTAAGKGAEVLFISDAHSQPEAQQKIDRLLRRLARKFNARTIVFEGAAGDLDGRNVFHSFPDQKKLRAILNDHLRKGEMSGISAAALKLPSRVRFTGLEDWRLYEQGFRAYRSAAEAELEILPRLAEIEKNLSAEKKRAYSPELLRLDRLWHAWEENKRSLDKVLLESAAIRPPAAGTPADALYELIRPGHADSGPQIGRLAGEVATQLQTNPRYRKFVPKFHSQMQQYRTSQISGPDFIAGLVRLIETARMPVKIPAGWRLLTQRRAELIANQPDDLMRSLEEYAASSKAAFFRTPEHKRLDFESRRLQLLKGLARRTLTRGEWLEIKKEIPPDLSSLFEPHVLFYKTALEREEQMIRRLTALCRENQGTAPVVMVAGGFHAEGITAALKNEGISYAWLVPDLQTSLPDSEQLYAAHMQSQIWWQPYLSEENGAVNLNRAFSRAFRDELLSVAINEKLSRNHFWILQRWRENLQEPADPWLTNELLNKKYSESLRKRWLLNILHYTRRLKKIQNRPARLNAAHAHTAPVAAPAVLSAQSDLAADLFTFAARSEVRMDLTADNLKKALGKSLKVSKDRRLNNGLTGEYKARVKFPEGLPESKNPARQLISIEVDLELHPDADADMRAAQAMLARTFTNYDIDFPPGRPGSWRDQVIFEFILVQKPPAPQKPPAAVKPPPVVKPGPVKSKPAPVPPNKVKPKRPLFDRDISRRLAVQLLLGGGLGAAIFMVLWSLAGKDKPVEPEEIKGGTEKEETAADDVSAQTLASIRKNLAGIGEYVRKVGVDSSSGQPFDHVMVDPRSGAPVAPAGRYSAPSKLGAYLPFLIKVSQQNPLLSDIGMTQQEADKLLLQALGSLRKFQKDGALRGEIYAGLFPWFEIYGDGTLGIAPYAGRRMIPVLDNGQLSMALAAVAGAFWDRTDADGRHIRQLAAEILDNQHYEQMVDPVSGQLFDEYDLERKQGVKKAGHASLWTEWSMAQYWAYLNGHISEQAWLNLPNDTFHYSVNTNGPLINMPQGYIFSMHETGWPLLYMPFMKSDLAPLLYNYLFLHADHAHDLGLAGFVGTEYGPPPEGKYLQAGIDLATEGKGSVLGPIDTDRLVSVYATALATPIYRKVGLEWTAHLLNQPGVVKKYGPVTSFTNEAGASVMHTADTTFVSAAALAGGVQDDVALYFKRRYGRTDDDLIKPLNAHARAILNRLGQRQFHTVASMPLPGDDERAVREISAQGETQSPPDISISQRMVASDRHGHQVRPPASHADLVRNPEEMWVLHEGEVAAEYKINTAAARPYAWLGTTIDPIRIGHARYLSLWVPANLDERWEIELKHTDLHLFESVVIHTTQPHLVIEESADRTWRHIAFELHPPIAAAKSLAMNYFAVSVRNPEETKRPAEGLIHFKGMQLHQFKPEAKAAGPAEVQPAAENANLVPIDGRKLPQNFFLGIRNRIGNLTNGNLFNTITGNGVLTIPRPAANQWAGEAVTLPGRAGGYRYAYLKVRAPRGRASFKLELVGYFKGKKDIFITSKDWQVLQIDLPEGERDLEYFAISDITDAVEIKDFELSRDERKADLYGALLNERTRPEIMLAISRARMEKAGTFEQHRADHESLALSVGRGRAPDLNTALAFNFSALPSDRRSELRTLAGALKPQNETLIRFNMIEAGNAPALLLRRQLIGAMDELLEDEPPAQTDFLAVGLSAREQWAEFSRRRETQLADWAAQHVPQNAKAGMTIGVNFLPELKAEENQEAAGDYAAFAQANLQPYVSRWLLTGSVKDASDFFRAQHLAITSQQNLQGLRLDGQKVLFLVQSAENNYAAVRGKTPVIPVGIRLGWQISYEARRWARISQLLYAVGTASSAASADEIRKSLISALLLLEDYPGISTGRLIRFDSEGRPWVDAFIMEAVLRYEAAQLTAKSA